MLRREEEGRHSVEPEENKPGGKEKPAEDPQPQGNTDFAASVYSDRPDNHACHQRYPQKQQKILLLPCVMEQDEKIHPVGPGTNPTAVKLGKFHKQEKDSANCHRRRKQKCFHRTHDASVEQQPVYQGHKKQYSADQLSKPALRNRF